MSEMNSGEDTSRLRKNILIVEDEAAIALELKMQLRSFGHNVVAQSATGEEAIVLAENLRPDLVLMDVKLGGKIDGFSAAQVLREEFDIPTVFLTAFADDESVRRAMPSEPYGYILKPYSKRELNLALELALQKREIEVERRTSRRILDEANFERERALERYALFFRSAPSGLLVCLADGLIVECNPAAEKILGVEKHRILGQECFGEKWSALTSTRDPLPENRNPVVMTLEHGSGVRDLEMEFQKTDGTRIWILVNTEAIRGANDHITHVVISFLDTTSQRESQNARRKMHNRLQAAVATSQMVLWEWDLAKGNLNISAYGTKCILGYADSILENGNAKGWIENTHPEDKSLVEKSLNEVLLGRVPIWTIEHRLRAADGSWRWVQQIGRITERSINNDPTFMVGTTQDVHEKHVTQEHSKLAAQRLHLALADSGVGIWSYNLRTEECIWDERTYNIFGIDKGAMKPREIMLAHIHADDRASVLNSIDMALDRLGRFEHTFRYTLSDGSLRYIRSFGSAQSDKNQKPQWISGVVEDVTEKIAVQLDRNLENELLVQATKAARLGVWRYGLTDQNLIWSKRMLEIFGVERSPTLQEFMTYVHPGDRAKVAETEMNARAGIADDQIEFRIITKGGQTLYLQNEMSIHLGADGLPEWLAGVCQDVTERRQLHERQRALETELMRSQKLETIGTFAGGIAHDFNNLLTGILGFIDLAIARSDRDREVTVFLQNSKAGAVRARDLVKQLLLFARKGPEIERIPFEVSVVIREVAVLLSSLLPSTITIKVENAPTEAFVMGDPGRIHQVIMNLAVNASHAIGNRPGSIVFGIRTNASTDSKIESEDCVYIFISDTGCGMDEDTKSKIFDPFYTTKGSTGGTGLGLSIAYGIIADHNGSIAVESTLGSGTTFTIRLPLTTARPSSVINEDAIRPLEGQGRRILIVDDRPEIRKLASTALRSFGFEVIACDGGESAINRISTDKEPYSVVLLDLSMPGIDGIQVLKVIKRVWPNLPILLMSGNYDHIDPIVLSSIGSVRRLPKPFTIHDLVESVRGTICSQS